MILESVFILHLPVICLQTDLRKDSKLSFNFFHQPYVVKPVLYIHIR